MRDENQNSAEEAANLAVKTATDAAIARENARDVQGKVHDEKIAGILAAALKDVFGEHESSGRFIDTARIPMICKDIAGLTVSVSKIEDNLKWITRLIIGAVVLALLGLVLVKR